MCSLGVQLNQSSKRDSSGDRTRDFANAFTAYQRNQASLRALKHQCLFDFDFRRKLLSRTRLSHRALKMTSSSLLTDGALAKWEASLKRRPRPIASCFSN